MAPSAQKQKVALQPYRLTGIAQRYAWGKMGQRSLVGQLTKCGPTEENTPLAELWFGAHPKSPSVVEVGDGELSTLTELIATDPTAMIGAVACARHGTSLPFLMKVLSVDQPLSIQLHPDLSRAKKLHEVAPSEYPDANHKPELAVAITPVTLLRGCKSDVELLALLTTLPELSAILSPLDRAQSAPTDGFEPCSQSTVGNRSTVAFKALERLFALDSNMVADISTAIERRFRKSPSLLPIAPWFLGACAIHKERDPGLLLMLLLELVTLAPGEAIYIPANIPHAYLDGDMVECMANSDNVVRAGLTPKYIDVKSFLDLVDVSSELPETKPMRPQLDGAQSEYIPPVSEFSLVRNRGTGVHTLPLNDTAAILLCLSGKAELHEARGGHNYALAAGDAMFIPAACAAITVTLQKGDLFTAIGGAPDLREP